MLKNTLSLYSTTSSSAASTKNELIYCTSPPSPPSPLSYTNSSLPTLNLSSFPLNNNNNNNNSIFQQTPPPNISRFSFNIRNLFTTFFILLLFSCYFLSVAYHWLNLYPNSIGLPLGMKFLVINQKPEHVFSLIDQMQQFGRDHQKSLDFIHVFVTIPLFTCFIFGLWFDSFLSSSNSIGSNSSSIGSNGSVGSNSGGNTLNYSNHHHQYSSPLMRIAVCFAIGLQLLLSWMEKVMIMVLIEKHPFDVRMIGKHTLLKAIQEVEILNWTSKGSLILGILLLVGGFWCIRSKNKQESDFYTLPFESNSSSAASSSLATMATTNFGIEGQTLIHNRLKSMKFP